MLTLTTLPSCPQHRQWRAESTCRRQGISRVNGAKLRTTAERTDFNGSNTPKCRKSLSSFQKTGCSFRSFELIFIRQAKNKSPANPHGYRTFWRRGWDSNQCAIARKLISSQPRYDHFDTSPCIFIRSVSEAFLKFKIALERTDGKNIRLFNYSNCKSPCKQGIFGGRNGQSARKFRVSPVMTTSIPLCIQFWCGRVPKK